MIELPTKITYVLESNTQLLPPNKKHRRAEKLTHDGKKTKKKLLYIFRRNRNRAANARKHTTHVARPRGKNQSQELSPQTTKQGM